MIAIHARFATQTARTAISNTEISRGQRRIQLRLPTFYALSFHIALTATDTLPPPAARVATSRRLLRRVAQYERTHRHGHRFGLVGVRKEARRPIYHMGGIAVVVHQNHAVGKVEDVVNVGDKMQVESNMVAGDRSTSNVSSIPERPAGANLC